MNRKKTVYLADDDIEDRVFLMDALKSVNPEIEIIEAEHGAALIEKLQDTNLPDPSLIIVDMNMPKMNGLEALANIKDMPVLSDIPAVMVSTSSNPDMITYAIQLGATGYFVKPANVEAFLDLAQQLILILDKKIRH